MADQGELEYASATGHDHAAHDQTYRNFVNLVKGVLAVIVVILSCWRIPRLRGLTPAAHSVPDGLAANNGSVV